MIDYELFAKLVSAARILSGEANNTEYNRGMIELIMEAIEADIDDREAIASLVGINI